MAIFTLRIFTFSAVSLFVLGFLPHGALTADSKTESSYVVNATKLLADLLTDYDRRVIPAEDGPVEVGMHLNMMGFELDEYNMRFKFTGYVFQYWTDSRLKWDSKKYNINDIKIPLRDIWSPDITLYNYLDHSEFSENIENSAIQKTGRVMLFQRLIDSAFCEIDMFRFPFDTQTCKLTYGSWLYGGDDVNLTTMSDQVYNFRSRGFNKWHLEKRTAKINVKKYKCCKEKFYDYTATFVLRRRSQYFSCLIVFPVILISALVPFIFLLSPESKERITLGIAIIALCLMELNELNSVIPRHHQNIPIIVTYNVLTLVWVSLSVVLSIFILNIHNRGPRRKKVPDMIRQIFLRGIRHLVCLGGDTYYAVDEEDTLNMRGLVRSNEREANTGVQGGQAVSKSEMYMDEIKKYVQYLAQRSTVTDARQEILAEWQQVALVIDRILFVFFSLTFVISTISVFA